MKSNIKNLRIGQLEFGPCTYLKDPPKHPGWEIKKWYPNPHYNKKDNFEHVGGGRYRYKAEDYISHYYVYENTFKIKECCYSIACWRWDEHEGMYELSVVGNRLLDINDDGLRQAFWQLYEYGEQMLNERDCEEED